MSKLFDLFKNINKNEEVEENTLGFDDIIEGVDE